MDTEERPSAPNGISPFERIRRTNAAGAEYWSSRDFAQVLGYSDYRNFEQVIKRAKTTCFNSGQRIEDHFVEITEMIEIGKGGRRPVATICMSRYACYLIVQNADPSKEIVAMGQTYFAIQTRRQELTDEATEEERRLLLREEMKLHNIRLASTDELGHVVVAKDFAIFWNHAYKGLYGGSMRHVVTKESQLPTFFKYFSDDDNVIRGIFIDGRIRFTQPAALNDPLEFNPVIRFRQPKGRYTYYVFDGVRFPHYQDWIYHQLLSVQVDNSGILSLTTDPDNFDMWSRYANGHKGFLVEFKAGFNQYMRGRNGEVYDIRKVEYTPDYTYYVEDLIDEHGEIHRDVFNARMFFTKSARWADESEWRMVHPLADHKWWHPKTDFTRRDRENYLFPFSLDCVQSVTFGACMSPQNRRKITDACKEKKIQFFQAMIVKGVRDSYGHQGIVTRNPIPDLEVLRDLPDTGVMHDGWTDEEHAEIRKAPIEIHSLSGLPYYVGSEDQVLQYYQKAKLTKSPSPNQGSGSS